MSKKRNNDIFILKGQGSKSREIYFSKMGKWVCELAMNSIQAVKTVTDRKEAYIKALRFIAGLFCLPSISIPTEPSEPVFAKKSLKKVQRCNINRFMGFYTFIQGGFRGKVGDHIGQKQGGKYIQKAYVVPKNPQSPAQTAQRNKFKSANDFARISLYWFEKNALESYRKNDFLNERVKKYFEVRERLEDSLEPLQMPRYESSNPYYYEVTCEPDYESSVNLFIDYQRNTGIPDTPPPPFSVKAYCLLYNFETATFTPFESSAFEDETFSDVRELSLSVDIDIGKYEEYINNPFYVFLEIDGKRSDSFYGFAF